VQRGRILVGHNRKATQGSINSINAHPFHSGNIVLVHNGTLRGDHKKDYAPVDVDSHALAIAFDEQGAENVIPKINGAFALIWWDVSKNRLFAVRNDERPLSIVETDEFYVVLSEPWMAMQLLAREHKKVLDVIDIEPGKLHEFEIGGNYTIKDIEVQKGYYANNYTGVTGRHKVQTGGAQTPSVQTGKSHSSSANTTGAGSKNQSGTTSTTTSQKPQTALTVVKAVQQARGEGQAAHGGVEAGKAPRTPMDAAAHVPCDDFMVGQTILVKLYEMKLNDSQDLYYCRGKVAEPNCPEIDVATYLKVADIKLGDQPKYVNRAVEAKILKHTNGVCGRSLYVNKVSLPTYVRVHNNDIAENEWAYVYTYCKCGTCSAQIYEEECEYTAVTRRPNNLYTVTCADCIEKTLKGQAQYEFQQNRLATVQAHIGKCDTASSSTVRGIETSGPSTLH
jgi:hypothetical protein